MTFQLPVNVSPEPEERFCHFSWRNSALKETLKKLQGTEKGYRREKIRAGRADLPVAHSGHSLGT